MTNDPALVGHRVKKALPGDAPSGSMRLAASCLALLATVSLSACHVQTPGEKADLAKAACEAVYSDNKQQAEDCTFRQMVRILAANQQRKQAEADGSINP